MKILSPSLLVFACVTVAWAQDAVTTTSPILTEKQSREAAPPRKILPPAPHEISPETTAKIRADLPSYTQPKSALARESEPVDMREIDKPRNTIPRLPKKVLEEHVMPHAGATTASLEVSGDVVALPPYTVNEEKIPNFKERELLTPKGKLELAYKRHPGLKFNPLFFLSSNDGGAMAMLEEEFRLERMQEMKELTGLYLYSDPKNAAETKRIMNQTFSRHDGP